MGDAQAAEAADQMGHRLGAESENASDEHESRVKKWMSEAFHEFAQRLQGHDPAQLAAEQQAQQGGGLSVQKEDTPDPTAGPAAPSTDGQEASGGAGSPAGSSPGPSEHPGVP